MNNYTNNRKEKSISKIRLGKENDIYMFIAGGLLIIGLIISLYFLHSSWNDGFQFWGNTKVDFGVTGQVGDFIGGVVGTAFGLAGTLLIFLSFKEQTKQNKKEGFESTFFEMIRLHRQNVSELSYKKFDGIEFEVAENRRVFKMIFEEFLECYREVKKFTNSSNPDDYLSPKQKELLNSIIKNNQLKIDVTELAIIDIAYNIVFFGVAKDGDIIIKSRFNGRYKNTLFYSLISYIRLKPKKENETRWSKWSDLNKLPYKDFKQVNQEFYNYRKHLSATNLSSEAKKLIYHTEYKKYYGGHQHRLGHYFRHLFQSYKYLNYHIDLTDNEKYYYGKTFRAQLSTYEQALLFINSISTLGFKWELKPEFHLLAQGEDSKNCKLITRYNLIKNLPGFHFFGIRYNHYYPNVRYEAEE